MDIKQLTYFISVYEHTNLSHAASHLSVAQSAVSHHISNLEAEFGTSLFMRKPRGMEPTAAGLKLYNHACHIVASVKAAENDMLSEAQEITGEIVIGLPFSVMKGIGVKLMKGVLTRYPKIRLSIVEGLSGNIQSNLLSSEVDLALFYNPHKDRNITMEHVLEEEVFCIGTKSTISDTDLPITFNDLIKLPLLMLREGGASRALINKPGLLAKLDSNALLQLNSITGITDAMLEGFGCTIAPKLFVQEYLHDGRLHARPIINPYITRHLYMGCLRSYSSSILLEAIKSLILELIKTEISASRWIIK